MLSSFRCSGLTAFFLVLAAAPLCMAQFSSSIQGLIRDQSDAGVARASVTLTNTSNGVSQETTTDDSGGFRFVSLAPGPYKLSAKVAGFSRTDVNLTLQTGQNLNVPVSLQVATSSTEINVTGAAPVLDTAETRTEQTVQSQELSALPLPGRNMVNLVTLAPGVTGKGVSAFGSPGSAPDNFSTELQVDASANGRSSNANMYVIDGLDVTSNIRPGVLNLTPNPDSVQESTTEVNTFSSQYGRGSSIVNRMTTKSGSDQFHGLVSDYFTYQNFWATTQFARRYVPFHAHNMSANVGGPILKNKQLYFFFGIEPLRSTQAAISSVTYESPEFVNFARQQFPATLGTQLVSQYSASAATTTSVAQTAGQVLPGTCGTAATSFIPCNLPVINNGSFSVSNLRNGLQFNGRVDKYWQKDRLYGNYFRTTLDTSTGQPRPDFSTANKYVTDSIQVNHTHTFTPTFLNEASFAFLRVQGQQLGDANYQIPRVNVNGINSIGSDFAQATFTQHSYHWRDVLTYIRGTHTIRGGYGGWRGDDIALFAGPRQRPVFQFNNILDLVRDRPQRQENLSFNPLTGQPQPANYGYGNMIHGLFIEDSWKAKSNLTVTYGLRWDDFGNPYTALAGTNLSNFYLGAGSSFNQQVANGSMVKQNNVLSSRLWQNFSPRVGFAWDPSSKGAWVVRGGFGFYHDMPTLGNMENGLNQNPPGYVTPTFFSNGTTAAPIFALGTTGEAPYGFPYPAFQGTTLNSQGGLVGRQLNVGGVNVGLTAPTTMNYTATVEHKLIGNIVGSVGYAGSKSYNIISGYGQTGNTSYGIDINRFAGDLILNARTSPTRLNQSFGQINFAGNYAKAQYNALIASVRGRLTNKLYFSASYTRSSSKDNSQVYPTFDNIDRYFAPSAWDTPHRFSLTWNYELPGYKDGRGLTGRILSGWSISGTSIFQSGTPFTVSTNAAFQPVIANGVVTGLLPGSGDFNADGFNLDYPNVTSYQTQNTRARYLNGFFNPGTFVTPALGQGGNQTPNQFRNARYAETGATLFKNVAIWERVNLQLRWEVYNVFNHTNLNGVTSNLADGNFGRVTSQLNPRWMQVGAKITF